MPTTDAWWLRESTTSEAEIERLTGLLVTATARINELEAMLDGLPALVEATRVEERSPHPDVSRSVFVGQDCLVYVMSPRFVKDCAGDNSNITIVGRRMDPDAARHVVAELLRAEQEFKRLKAEYAATPPNDGGIKG